MAWIKLENGTYLDPSCVKEVECESTIMYERGTGTKTNSNAKAARIYNDMEVLAKGIMGNCLITWSSKCARNVGQQLGSGNTAEFLQI